MTKPIYESFSFEEYLEILRAFSGRWSSFCSINENFVIMRHDVEFSIDRALAIGELEYKQGVSSTFNFQVCCDTYNVSSPGNSKAIRELSEMGHHIGLHFYVSHIIQKDWQSLENELDRQKRLLNAATGLTIDRFSFHRPKKWMLSELRSDRWCDLINEYGDSFFEFSDKPEDIKYFADSRHAWDYGHPLDYVNSTKIQVLTHPDEWSPPGLKERENFHSLKQELSAGISDTFLRESPKNFEKYSKII